MKFGHLLSTFGAEAEVPPSALLNYKKLKKLIKAQRKGAPECEAPPSAAATAASGEGNGCLSDEEEARSAGPGQVTAAAVAQVQPGSSAAAAGSGQVAAAVAVVAAADQAAAAIDEAASTAAPAAARGAAAAGAAPAEAAGGGVAEEDREFIQTLQEDLSRINSYFMEQEEEAVIRLRALQDARSVAFGSGAAAAKQLEQLRSEMVDFHGELVLLLHWSLVNYAAVAKILKKHDKLTGSRLRAPVLASVLHQPFLSTESISQLVKAAERHVQELTDLCGSDTSVQEAEAAEGSAEAGRDDPGEVAMADSGTHVAMYKRTRAALHMLSDMQETASTPSTLLPPSTAHSDAVPGGQKVERHQDKKARSGPAQQAQQAHQERQPSVEVQAH